MSKDLCGRRGVSPLARLFLVLLLLLMARLVWRPYVAYDDFWAHAAVGRWIWQQGQVPSHTLFLWTASEPWVAHSWLSQLVFYGLLTADGEGPPFLLLRLFTCLLTGLPVVLLWRLWRSQAPSLNVPALLFMLALVCSRSRFSPRPELFTVLFLTVLALALIRRPTGGSRGLFALGIFLLFVTWANFHGGVALGLLLLAATAVCDLLQGRFRKDAWASTLLLLVATAAVCATPYGLRYWQAFRPVGGRMFAFIVEWRPFWKSPVVPWPELVAIALIQAVALLACLRNASRRWSHIAWALVLTGSYLAARRNVWPMLVVSLAVLAANARAIDVGRLFSESARAGACVVVLAAWAGLMLVANFFLVPLSPDDPDLPTGLAQFIREKELPGRAFNDYPTSGYFEWQLRGRVPLYIDQLNAYPEELHLQYGEVLRGPGNACDLLEAQGVGYVLLASPNPEGPWLRGLAAHLEDDRRWARVYSQDDGAVWARRTPEYEYLWRPKSARAR
jgi:hypothetical protein